MMGSAEEGGLLGLLTDRTEPLGRLTGPILSPVAQAATPVTDALGKTLQPAVGPLRASIDTLAGPALPAVGEITKAVEPVTTALESSLAPVVETVADTAVKPVTNLATPVVETVADTAAPVVKMTADVAVGPVTHLADPVVETVAGVAVAPVSGIAAPVIETVADTAAPAVTMATDVAVKPATHLAGPVVVTTAAIASIADLDSSISDLTPALIGEATPSPAGFLSGLLGSSGPSTSDEVGSSDAAVVTTTLSFGSLDPTAVGGIAASTVAVGSSVFQGTFPANIALPALPQARVVAAGSVPTIGSDFAAVVPTDRLIGLAAPADLGQVDDSAVTTVRTGDELPATATVRTSTQARGHAASTATTIRTSAPWAPATPSVPSAPQSPAVPGAPSGSGDSSNSSGSNAGAGASAAFFGDRWNIDVAFLGMQDRDGKRVPKGDATKPPTSPA